MHLYVTLDHKISHKGKCLETVMYTSSESMNKWIIFALMYGLLWSDNICKSGIWGCLKNLNIEKIIFKVVQIKFLAMHITNQKLCFDIFTVQNIFMEHMNMKIKINNFDPYNILLAIATNTPQRLNTAFVLQGHVYSAALDVMYFHLN